MVRIISSETINPCNPCENLDILIQKTHLTPSAPTLLNPQLQAKNTKTASHPKKKIIFIDIYNIHIYINTNTVQIYTYTYTINYP